MTTYAVPFHFTTTLFLTVIFAGAAWAAWTRPELGIPRGGPRRIFASGWAALALADALHGASVLTGDLDSELVALRFGGMALIVFAMLPRRGGAAPVALAIGPAFLGLAGAWLSYRGAIKSNRLAVAFLLFSGAEVLFAVGGGEASLVWFAAHAARLAAGFLVASWIAKVAAASIQLRLVGIFLSILLLSVVLVSSAMSQIFSTNVTREAFRRAEDDARGQQQLIQRAIEDAVSDAGQIADTSSAQTLTANQDRESLSVQTRRFQEPGGLFDSFDVMAFLDSSGQVLAISAAGQDGAPTLDEAEAIALAGTDVVQSALSGQPAGSLDTLASGRIALLGAHPVPNPQGFDPPGTPRGIAGALVFGSVLDDDYLAVLQREGEQEAFIITPSRVVASTSAETQGLLANRDVIRRRVFDEQAVLTRRGLIGTTEYFSSYVPLERTDNVVVAALVISQRSAVLQQTQRDVGQTLFMLALLATAIAIALSYFSGLRITRPIRDLTAAADRMSGGELGAEVKADGADEVAALGRSFNSMSTSLMTLTGDLRNAVEQEFQLRSRLETILQSMSDGVVAVDADANVVTVNREAERILGRKSDKLLGRPVAELLQLTNREGKEVRLPLATLASGSATGTTRSGIPLGVTSSPIKDDAGNIVGGVAVLRDLGPEMEVERMKTEFLSNISHELRTPLTPIKGYAELMRSKEFPRKERLKFLGTISQSAEALERTVNMLVDFSQMEAGRLTPRQGTVDLAEVVSNLVTKWSKRTTIHKFEKKGFRGLPKITGDERLLPLAIGELIDNAVKFSPDGGKVQISAEVDSSASNGRRSVKLSVIDQGIGMSPEDINNSSQDFSQRDASATRTFGGLGLGLAYVRRVVEAHDGSLEVQSTPGAGSRFTMTLPVPTGKTSRASSRKPASKDGKSRYKRAAGVPISKGRKGRRKSR